MGQQHEWCHDVQVVDLRKCNLHVDNLLRECVEGITHWEVNFRAPSAILITKTQGSALAQKYDYDGLPQSLFGYPVLVDHGG